MTVVKLKVIWVSLWLAIIRMSAQYSVSRPTIPNRRSESKDRAVSVASEAFFADHTSVPWGFRCSGIEVINVECRLDIESVWFKVRERDAWIEMHLGLTCGRGEEPLLCAAHKTE